MKKNWDSLATLEDALDHGLTENEFKNIVSLLQRDLNMVELGICSALYSEHCSYKSTKYHLKNLPTSGKTVLQGPGENAGVVDIGYGQAVVFKVESHNHPSFIEPFQGAATGVGGILRDIFTMGARPLALMNALRFGAAENSRTPYLLSRAVKGIGSYGNCMGIPTVGGELYFHESYNGNCLVNAFCLGLVDHKNIFRGRASGIGNSVIYVGSKTGRDGIHGATMSSEEFAEDSESKRPTVQVGDPFYEKLLMEACLQIMEQKLVVGIQDMGAAGLTCSVYEMADRAGTGIRIDLDKVPQREEGMTPYEIMLSESQERMLVVVEPQHEKRVFEAFQHWELDAVKIGEVIEGKNADLYWNGKLFSSMSVDVVTSSVPQYRWPEKKPDDFDAKNSFDALSVEVPADLGSIWLRMLGSINLSSRFPVYRQYDSTIRSNTVVHPGGDAALLRIKGSSPQATERGVAMTLDCNVLYCSIDPHQGTALSLAEGIRNLAAVGARPIGISDCLNFGNPTKPEGMWQIAESIRGLSEAARAFDVPVISGNVSLNNENNGKAILPTPLLAVVGLLDDVSKAVAINFVKEDDVVLVFGDTNEKDLGGSEYLSQIYGIERGALPLLAYDKEIETAAFIRSLIDQRMIKSCHDISSGGLSIALAECCFSTYSAIGASLNVESYKGREDSLLFAESGARYIVSCDSTHQNKIRELAASAKINIGLSGVVGGDVVAINGVASLALSQAYEIWKGGLCKLL